VTDPKGQDMATNQIDHQYSTGLSRRNIERALISAGLDLDRLQPADLGMLEDFHTMGRIATSQLVDLAGITRRTEVLDAGSGVGGTARYVAERYGCTVTAVDLTEEYCDTSRWLNHLVGLDDRITVQCADVTALPFVDGAFQVVVSQHVQMNVADKEGLYREARRVLADGGVLAMWDITRARDAAWTNAEALWALRGTESLANRYLSTLDRTVGFASRGLLNPADTWVARVGRFLHLS